MRMLPETSDEVSSVTSALFLHHNPSSKTIYFLGTPGFKEAFSLVEPGKGSFASCASLEELRTVVELTLVQGV